MNSVIWIISLTVNFMVIITFIKGLEIPSNMYHVARYNQTPQRLITTTEFENKHLSSEKRRDLTTQCGYFISYFKKSCASNIEDVSRRQYIFEPVIHKKFQDKSQLINVRNILTSYNDATENEIFSKRPELQVTDNTILEQSPNQTSIKNIANEITSLLLGQDINSTQGTKILTEVLFESTTVISKLRSVEDNFYKILNNLERNFYLETFTKLALISPENRKENGISFVQSALFLQLVLIALSTEVDIDCAEEINNSLKLQASYEEKILMIKNILSTLPQTNSDLKFFWSSRLVLWPGREVSDRFQNEMAPTLQLGLDRFNGTEKPDQIARALNNMVEHDTEGAIHDTFDENEISDDVKAVLLTTLYLRGRWRSAPTVLNGTKLFKDAEGAPQRFVRFIRINDIMRYANLPEWDAEAIEIYYATPGLSLLLLVPRGRSLKYLAELVARTSIDEVTRRMYSLRIGVTLPLYTLRMTLLLPNKLESMGISKLMGVNDTTTSSLTLSHAVQRIMFWAEAGRNAFKDDGIEWDEVPELELVVDRPYIFFVRWNNLTIMNGNFVL